MAQVRCINDFEWRDEPDMDDNEPKTMDNNTESLSKMQVYDVSELNRSTVHREYLSVKYCVVSAEYVFNKLYRRCVRIQLDTLGYDDADFRCEMSKWISSKRYRRHNAKPEKRHNSYIYTNNYIIFVDTVFRMVTLFDRYISNIRNKRCVAEQIVLINDISWTSIPRCHQIWNFATKSYCTREKIASMMIQELKLISETFRNEELDEFETFNTYLMKSFPELYHIDYFHPEGKVLGVTREGKENIRKRFMYLASLLQMQLTMKEIYLAWMVTFDVLAKRKNINAFTMIEPWGRRNVPRIVLERQYTAVNIFKQDQWVGMKDRHEGKCDNVNAMNALSDWRQFKCKYTEVKQTAAKAPALATVQKPKRAGTPTNKKVTRKRTKGKRAETPKITSAPKPKKLTMERYRNDSNVFNFNIIHIFCGQKCLFITRKFVPYPNIFYFKSKAAHYPIISKKYAKCELDTGARLIRYVPHNRTLLSCFDDINLECAERVLDLNDSLRVMMFDDMKALYTEDTVGPDVIRPDGYSEFDYSWITKEMIYEFMPDVITKFNKHFKTEVV